MSLWVPPEARARAAREAVAEHQAEQRAARVHDCTDIIEGPCRYGEGWHVSGCHYDDPEEAFLGGVLGFCGCGMDYEVTALMRTYLGLVAQDDRPGVEAMQEACGGAAGWMLVAYVADRARLTEHGGAVVGAWISPLGTEWLQRLTEYEATHPDGS